MSQQHANVAVIGAGIVGLAHAYVAAKDGRSVAVFDRRTRSEGASARGFGLIAPITQGGDKTYAMAVSGRELWMELLQAARLPYQPSGSLHLAYHADEADVIREFSEIAPGLGYLCQWLDPRGVEVRTQAVLSAGLLGALWSPTEVAVDPRILVRKIPEFLAERYGVRFCFGSAVRGIALPRIEMACCEGSGECWTADAAVVCAGDDFESLFPSVFARSGLRRSKAQIMRTGTQPGGWRLGPSLFAGLSLRSSRAFAIAPSLGRLKERIARELPEYDAWGIHVQVAQTPAGELTLGCSMEEAPDFFDKTQIDNLVLRYLRNFLQAPNLDVDERWHAIMARHPERPYWEGRPAENLRVVTGLGDADLTLCMGVARQVVAGLAL